MEPPFTLNKVKPGYICARTTFVELGDPTGYKWAIKYLGDWEHWLYLEKSSWFREALAGWRKELEVKQISESVRTIEQIAKDKEGDIKLAFSAAKYLAEQAWVKKATTRGRPSKVEVDAELKRAALERSIEDDDAERINLKLVSDNSAR